METQGDIASIQSDGGKFWLDFVQRDRAICLLTDLDGTLVPFANSPEEAEPTPEIVALLKRFAATPGLAVAVVSGRPRDFLDAHFGDVKGIRLVAEHGVWCRQDGNWKSRVQLKNQPTDLLYLKLESLARHYPGALIERKTFSLAIHYRRVKSYDRSALLVETAAITESWLREHDDYERLSGEQVIEIRPQNARKSSAIKWIRGELGFVGALLAVGDDVTDEDMFNALEAGDAAVHVGELADRPTAAAWRLKSVAEVASFYQTIIEARLEAAAAQHWTWPTSTSAGSDTAFDLVVVSNRLPELRSAPADDTRRRNVGGLVSALEPVLTDRRGIWLGWDGEKTADQEPTRIGIDYQAKPTLAWVTLSKQWYEAYYKGFCNSALWPLLHSFPERARFRTEDWEAYRRVNETFAEAVARFVRPSATVWIHDYHLFLAGKFLRDSGHTGPIGLFLHVPFPGPDIFQLLPWADEVLSGLLSLDVVGFHTSSYAENFRSCAARLGALVSPQGRLLWDEHRVDVGVFPIGIIPENFQVRTDDPAVTAEIDGLLTSLASQRLILGVDRLDYTKGIPERIAAYGELLRRHPEWQRRTAFVQVSVPSRADVPEYEEQRSRIEEIVGRVNGEFGAADWVPIRYLYRSYGHDVLQQLYRIADVGYVTPLRDGMNLVAKEFVAAQAADHPGVLLLSKLAGAAEELDGALLTNPWHAEGMADDLHRALMMNLDERKARHQRLLARVTQTTARSWAESFLGALAASRGA